MGRILATQARALLTTADDLPAIADQRQASAGDPFYIFPRAAEALGLQKGQRSVLREGFRVSHTVETETVEPEYISLADWGLDQGEDQMKRRKGRKPSGGKS
jgi:hypothetical protein